MEKQTLLHTSPSLMTPSENAASPAPVKVQDQFKENWREDRRENLREFSNELREGAGRLAEQVETRVKTAYEKSRNWAQENPRTAIGIASIAGLAALGGIFAYWYTSRKARRQDEPPSPTETPQIQPLSSVRRSA